MVDCCFSNRGAFERNIGRKFVKFSSKFLQFIEISASQLLEISKIAQSPFNLLIVKNFFRYVQL